VFRAIREPANGLTHLAGVVLALGTLVLLVRLALGTGSVSAIVAFVVFGLSLLALYGASAVHHAVPFGPVGIARSLRVDHMMIFVLIAGTYTPFCLLALDGAWRWALLAGIWALACAGIALKIGWMHAPVWLSTGLYVAMGWLALLAAPALLAVVPLAGLAWILAGGVIYTVGAIVFATGRPRLRPDVFGAHALWHLLVIAGSACHVWAVIRYLTPLA